ncbi:MAG: hypothetical protein AAGG48_23395 [Planctomycetota bacterium]
MAYQQRLSDVSDYTKADGKRTPLWVWFVLIALFLLPLGIRVARIHFGWTWTPAAVEGFEGLLP